MILHIPALEYRERVRKLLKAKAKIVAVRVHSREPLVYVVEVE